MQVGGYQHTSPWGYKPSFATMFDIHCSPHTLRPALMIFVAYDKETKQVWSKNFDKRHHHVMSLLNMTWHHRWRWNDPFAVLLLRIEDPLCCMPLMTIEWCFLLCTLQQRLAMVFKEPDNVHKLPLTTGSHTLSNTWFLGPKRVSPQTTSWSVQPFLHGSWMWPMDKQTDTMLLHL